MSGALGTLGGYWGSTGCSAGHWGGHWEGRGGAEGTLGVLRALGRTLGTLRDMGMGGHLGGY